MRCIRCLFIPQTRDHANEAGQSYGRIKDRKPPAISVVIDLGPRAQNAEVRALHGQLRKLREYKRNYRPLNDDRRKESASEYANAHYLKEHLVDKEVSPHRDIISIMFSREDEMEWKSSFNDSPRLKYKKTDCFRLDRFTDIYSES